MAKQTKHVQVFDDGGKGKSIRHHESYDDSLLPEASELAKLKELDPTVIDWIKEMTSKEQDGRLSFNDRKMSLLEKKTKHDSYTDFLVVIFAFLVIISSMALSCFLILQKQAVVGTIFAGGTMVLAANSFLDFKKKKESKKD